MPDAASAANPFVGLDLPAGDDLRATPAAPAARFVLRGDSAVAEAAVAAFGTAFPESINRAAADPGTGRATLCLGPDEWLFLAASEDPAALASRIGGVLAGQAHSLVDITHRQVGLVVAGRRSVRALSAGCPLDLRLSAFPVGMATRTLYLKAEIVLWRLDAQRFHIEVWRSFARYLAGHLSISSADTTA